MLNFLGKSANSAGDEGAAVVRPIFANAAGAEIISSYATVPNGTVISEVAISSELKSHIVALRTGANEAVILVTPEYVGTAQALDLRQRIAKWSAGDGGTAIRAQFRTASAEAVEFCWSSRMGSAHKNSASTTKVESSTKPEQLIGKLVDKAMKLGSSDIHIETNGGGDADVLFRINGERELIMNLSYETAKSVSQVLFFQGEEGSKGQAWHRHQLNDWGVTFTLPDGHVVNGRCSTLPRHPEPGFHLVMRAASQKPQEYKLEDAGYTIEQVQMIDNFLGRNSGLVAFCGPTNSGKSRSLAACVNRIISQRGEKIKVITAENPIENIIPSAIQVPVGGSLTFADVLRGILRQDSDVVVPGEIRDQESAELIRDAVLGGRKVLTTLHTTNALSAWYRLRELQVPWDLLVQPSFFAGVIFQRLVPVLCDHCKIPLSKGHHRLPRSTYERLHAVCTIGTSDIHVRGDGCDKCNHTGISGRTVVAELISPDRPFLQHLAHGRVIEAEQYWHDSKLLSVGGNGTSGGVTALAHVLHKIYQGTVDPWLAELSVDLLDSELTMAGSRSHLLSTGNGLLRKTGTSHA